VLELTPREVAIVACQGRPAALPAAAPAGGLRLSIAPDEIWWLGPRAARGELLAGAERWLAGVGDDGLVLDQTDGWAAISVTGDDGAALYGRVSVNPVPPGRPALVQGALAGVPGKVLFLGSLTLSLVPSPVGHHLLARLLEVGSDLTPRLGSPAPLDPADDPSPASAS